MTVLILTICTALACEDRRVPLEASALVCMVQAQAIAADPRVVGLRGDQRVARWRCGDARSARQAAGQGVEPLSTATGLPSIADGRNSNACTGVC